MKKSKERSPLDRAAPLRVAGQSITEELDDFVYDHVLTPFFVALFMVVFAGMEWFRYFQNLKPNPIIYSAAAALAVLYAAVKIWRGRAHVRRRPLAATQSRPGLASSA